MNSGTIIFITGQSNCNNIVVPNLFQKLSEIGPCFSLSHGGAALTPSWVNGASRGTDYNSLIAPALGLKPKKILLILIHGESDADSGSNTLGDAYAGKLIQIEGWLAADFPQTDSSTTTVRSIISLPYWASNATVAVQGYYTNLRNNLIAHAAASPTTRIVVDSSPYQRPTADVHLSNWNNSTVPGRLPNGSTDFVNKILIDGTPFFN